MSRRPKLDKVHLDIKELKVLDIKSKYRGYIEAYINRLYNIDEDQVFYSFDKNDLFRIVIPIDRHELASKVGAYELSVRLDDGGRVEFVIFHSNNAPGVLKRLNKTITLPNKNVVSLSDSLIVVTFLEPL